MGHTPYGYKIQDGKAVVDPVEASQLKELFEGYLSGLSMKDAAKQSGIKSYHATVAKMLTNKKYHGDAYYPQIIERDIFEQAGAEKLRRAKKLGRVREPAPREERLKKYKFTMPELEKLYENPFQQAEYAYNLIESEVVEDGSG